MQTPSPYSDLIRHAEKFGTDCVLETAAGVMVGISEQETKRQLDAALAQSAQLRRLRITLDAIDVRRNGGRVHRRRTVDEMRAAVLELRAEGKVPGYIAELLRITEPAVRRYLNGPRNPADSLAKFALNEKDDDQVVLTV